MSKAGFANLFWTLTIALHFNAQGR